MIKKHMYLRCPKIIFNYATNLIIRVAKAMLQYEALTWHAWKSKEKEGKKKNKKKERKKHREKDQHGVEESG